MTKKKISLLITLLLVSIVVFAQGSPDLASPARNFLTNSLRPLYPIIVAGVGMIGGVLNIGKVMGEQNDWKGFFTKIGLFLFGAIILVVVVEALYAMTINF